MGICKLIFDVRYVLRCKIRRTAQGARSMEIKVFKSKIRNPKSTMERVVL
jgi:hypothetical protein